MISQQKRKWQTEIENKKHQLEDDRRALQHLKVRENSQVCCFSFWVKEAFVVSHVFYITLTVCLVEAPT